MQDLSNVLIEDGAILHCPDDFPGEFILPDGCTAIGRWAFHQCSVLTGIHIPDSVTTIDDRSFHGCSSLASVCIPDRVGIIQSGTFAQCTSLSTVRIPAGCKTIEAGAFENCKSLSHVIVPEGCDVCKGAFPATCQIFRSAAEYRLHLAKEMAEEMVGDGVDIVGMHAPQIEQTVDSSGGRDI